MRVYRSNLMVALHTAICSLAEREKSKGYTSDSALLAGWREMLKLLEDGYNWELRD